MYSSSCGVSTGACCFCSFSILIAVVPECVGKGSCFLVRGVWGWSFACGSLRCCCALIASRFAYRDCYKTLCFEGAKCHLSRDAQV